MEPDGAVTVDNRDAGIVAGISPGHENDPPNLPSPEKLSGNYIAVYGVILPWIEGDLPLVRYSVDGDFEQVRIGQNVSTVQANALFYQINFPLAGVHTLTMNVTTASSDNPWLFDYLRYANAPNSTSTTDVASPSSTTVASAVPSSSDSSSFPTAPIVGRGVGGIVLIAALLAFLCYLWNRARTRAQELDLEGVKGKQNTPSPPFDARAAPEHSDSATCATDILPTLPPRKELQPMYSSPAMQPLATGPGPYPNWPRAPAQQQQWLAMGAVPCGVWAAAT
ncbi:hypothetical protein TRAPUB_13722 [Trametes pubescens]|uniref:Uncharacterized protein n=1 Tax=Trametes pubescens TaxID=154538 RepID=A0A1M2VQ87_TRAPU|nr:hypothetical protein TRAPUB_13722 [Trametes pubescens]